MPRPRIYHTKADRCAANHAKSACHYAKNKANILAKRCDLRAHGEDVRPQSHPEENPPAIVESRSFQLTQLSRLREGASHDTQTFIRLGHRTTRKLARFINYSPSAFAQSTYTKYIKAYTSGTNDIALIETLLEQLVKWKKHLDKCGEEVLQERGVGRELQTINSACGLAGEAIEYLQEILGDAMSNPIAMQAWYKRWMYAFQLV
ncbi:hypothetical protein BDN71DRAFT_1510917 [Pleurotus eryngii]|uniref:Uncharacterized protein n=1 Tax=Pleurotus eryngii TaxID=5323 RepID=A0A9P5ZPK8_PLEER|nr:hypothetical protein BDN71DRAFT_1510917 [Pleurotus eryngii]